MLCEICHERDAVFHIHLYVNGVSKDMHVCERCAKGQNLASEHVHALNIPEKIEIQSSKSDADSFFFSDVELTAQMLGQFCAQCQTPYETVIETGIFGCAQCWETFGPLIEDKLKRFHGACRHMPEFEKAQHVKIQKDAQVLQRLAESLKSRMNAAIAAEDYELAARLRDQIRQLDSDLETHHE